jgi:molybdopterin synthase catalytic subunit
MRVVIIFQQDALMVPALELDSRETGASVDFLGIVRELEGDQRLKGLWYEAYEPMAQRLLERMFSEVNELYPAYNVYFVHRIGWVPVGEASLFIRVQTAHRGEAFGFLSEAITRMKRDVPIWKRA